MDATTAPNPPVSSMSSPVVAQPPISPIPTYGQQSSSKKKILIIVGVVGLVILILVSILLFSQPSKNPETPQETVQTSPTPTEPLVLKEIPYGVLYGTTNSTGVFIKVYDFVTQKETVLSTLPTNIKKITVLSPTQILYINKTNEYDNGEELVLYDLKQKEPISTIKADAGFLIDEYVVSPNKTYVAVWEIAPNSSGTLIGGRSRVNTLSLKDLATKNRIYDEAASYDSPIHYPSAITNDGTTFMDTFLPNSGAGWAYGTSISNIDGTGKEDLAAMQSGTYGTKLSVSPKGDVIAFGGYDGSKGEGAEVIDGFRKAVIYVNTIELLDLQTKRRSKLANLPKDALFNAINWSHDGDELYFVAITKDPKTTGNYVYNVSAREARKIDTDRKLSVATALPQNKVLIGTLDNSLGNLGYTYAAPYKTLTVFDVITKQQIALPLQEGKVQFIGVVTSSYFPDVLGITTTNDTLLAQSGRKNLQLESFYPSPTPSPTPLAENRRQQQSDPLSPTPTTGTATRTPTPTSPQTGGVNLPTNTPRPTRTPTPTPQGGIVSCQDIARAQCTAQYPDDINARGLCIEDLKPILLQNGQCNSSPLYLYGKDGQVVKVTVHTPVSNTKPFSKGLYSVTLGRNGAIAIQGTNYSSIGFDYVPALRIYERPVQGSLVSRGKVGSVLQLYAEKLGLNEKESEDLVAYGKKVVTSPYVFISFFDQETSKKLLPIVFSPQPETYINYVFYFKQYNAMPSFSPQMPVFPSLVTRQGFTAVEISGMVE